MSELKKSKEAEKIEEIIRSMQEKNTIVVVEGQHDIEKLSNVVEYLSSKGRIEEKPINAVTYDKLLYNHLDMEGMRVIIAMDSDRRGKEKKESAIALIRARYPNALIDESTGEKLLKILGVNCIEGILRPIKEFEESRR
ncbi:MAG: hypothetical protein ACP5P2_03300 [Candidatus Micrarchaeia archaeon]